MKNLFKKIIFIILIVFLISFGIDCVYRYEYRLDYEMPQNIFILPEITDKYEIVKVGNSHADDGIKMDRYNLKSLELVRSAQSFDFDLSYLKMYSQQIKKGALIILTVSPIAFSQKKAGVEDSLQTQYYDGSISPFLIPNINVGDYLQSRIFPFLRTGFLWRERNNKFIQERLFKEQKPSEPAPNKETATTNKDKPKQQIEQLEINTMPRKFSNISQDSDYFKVSVIINELNNPTEVPVNIHEESVNFMFNKWYNKDGFDKKYFEANRRDLEKLIAYCLKKDWRPVMVTIPISNALLQALEKKYMQIYVYNNLALANLNGIEYFDFIKNKKLTMNNSLFSNSDHLNKKGAIIFSYLLLQKLIDRGFLSKEADGYDYSSLNNAQ